MSTGPNFCDKHTTKTIDWYCFDCKETICANCLTNCHMSHDYRNLDDVTDDLKFTLATGVEDLQKMYDEYKISLSEIEKEEREFMNHVQKIETEIIEDEKRLHEKIERIKTALLADVSLKKRQRQHEVEMTKEELRQQMALVKSLTTHTTELLTNGAAGNIAREANSLEKRARKLLQSDKYKTSINELGTFTLAYASREVEFSELGENFFGSISSAKVKLTYSLPEGNAIFGLTALNNELYVHHLNQGIAVYDTDTYNERRWLKVPGLGGVNDLTSCQRYKCIYISDWKNKVIHKVRVQTTGSRDEFTQWPVEDEPSGLSVNSDYDVVVTCQGASKIKVFTTDGKLVKVIQLQHAGILVPRHTIQLTDDKYVVCHGGTLGEVSDPLHRVCIVDGDGEVKHAFGGSEGSGDKLLNAPHRLAKMNGMILVIDINNDRVVMLCPMLRYVWTVVSFTKDGPNRIWFDEQTSRLYVSESKCGNGEWTTGHVNAYSVCS